MRSFFLSSANCGVIGGRPKQAYYLVGVQEQNLIILDPHNTQQALSLDEVVLQRHHTQLHEQTAKKIAFKNLDPTMTFAFYFGS